MPELYITLGIEKTPELYITLGIEKTPELYITLGIEKTHAAELFNNRFREDKCQNFES